MRRSFLIGFTALALVVLQSFPSAAMDADSPKDSPALKFDYPVLGPVQTPFGRRMHPIVSKSIHSGIDIAAPNGTKVKAAAPGEVLFEGWLRGYGNVVIIDHGRDYSTVYAHLSATQVKEGEVVSSGFVIGTVGNTGTATAEKYHLHFEVRDGETAKNPLKYLRSRKMCE